MAEWHVSIVVFLVMIFADKTAFVMYSWSAFRKNLVLIMCLLKRI